MSFREGDRDHRVPGRPAAVGAGPPPWTWPRATSSTRPAAAACRAGRRHRCCWRCRPPDPVRRPAGGRGDLTELCFDQRAATTDELTVIALGPPGVPILPSSADAL